MPLHELRDMTTTDIVNTVLEEVRSLLHYSFGFGEICDNLVSSQVISVLGIEISDFAQGYYEKSYLEDVSHLSNMVLRSLEDEKTRKKLETFLLSKSYGL